MYLCVSGLFVTAAQSASKSFYRLLVTFSSILICGFAKIMFSSYAYTWNAIAAFSEECVAKIVHGEYCYST